MNLLKETLRQCRRVFLNGEVRFSESVTEKTDRNNAG
jgi:Tfp pilus assembly ATPase PilU